MSFLALLIAGTSFVFAYKAWLAGEEQARAALEQADIAQRAFVAAESSSIYFGIVHTMTLPRPGERLEQDVQIGLGNSGGSATRDLVFFAACTTTERGAVNPFSRQRLEATQPHYLVLAPKAVVMPIACFHTEAELAKISQNRMSVYVTAEAFYRDTVNPDMIHHVEACDRLHDFTAYGAVSMSEQCSSHNCTDSECTEKQPALWREIPKRQ